MPEQPKGWGRIVLATRLEKAVDPDFFTAWSALITSGMKPGDAFLITKGRVAHQAANILVRSFLQSTQADTLCFIDSDCIMDSDFLQTFRDYEPGWDYDVLQAFYTKRQWPPEPVWFEQDVLGRYVQTLPLSDGVAPVAGVGLHATLIRRDVFETIYREEGHDIPMDRFDWFTYPRNQKMGEDIFFSQLARGYGFKVGATTEVRVGHIGTWVYTWDTYQEWLQISNIPARHERFMHLVDLVSEFTGEHRDLVVAKALKAADGTIEGWQKYAPQNAEEARAFYGQPDSGYLYDLIQWNAGEMYQGIIAPLRQINGKHVLVVGAGLGGEADALTDETQGDRHNIVDVFELPGALRDFCKFRLNGSVRHLPVDRVSDIAPAEPYDLVVAVDTLEHIHPDEWDETMGRLYGVLKPGGSLYCHNNFEEGTPMAFNHAEAFRAWAKQHDMEKVTEMQWRKISESNA